MIRATLTAIPQRWSVCNAKGTWSSRHGCPRWWLATCFVSLLLALVWFDRAWEIISATGGGRPAACRPHRLLTWVVMSLTILFRNQTFALVAMYLWPMAIETRSGLAVLPCLEDYRD